MVATTSRENMLREFEVNIILRQAYFSRSPMLLYHKGKRLPFLFWNVGSTTHLLRGENKLSLEVKRIVCHDWSTNPPPNVPPLRNKALL